MQSFSIKIDVLVKSHETDDTVKSSSCKARKYEGMKHTYGYAAMTEDATQRSRWTFLRSRQNCFLVCSRLAIMENLCGSSVQFIS